MPKADYIVGFEDDVLVIFDINNGAKSVTNDIENVVADLASKHDLDRNRIVYRDSEGCWTGIMTRNGAFGGFVYLGVHDQNSAVVRAKLLGW